MTDERILVSSFLVIVGGLTADTGVLVFLRGFDLREVQNRSLQIHDKGKALTYTV